MQRQRADSDMSGATKLFRHAHDHVLDVLLLLLAVAENGADGVRLVVGAALGGHVGGCAG